MKKKRNHTALFKKLKAYEKQIIEQTFAASGYNKAATAKALGVSDAHLYLLIKRHGLDCMGKEVQVLRYSNGVLYRRKTSSTVSVSDLFRLAANGEKFQVIDRATRRDVTAEVLTKAVKV